MVITISGLTALLIMSCARCVGSELLLLLPLLLLLLARPRDEARLLLLPAALLLLPASQGWEVLV